MIEPQRNHSHAAAASAPSITLVTIRNPGDKGAFSADTEERDPAAFSPIVPFAGVPKGITVAVSSGLGVAGAGVSVELAIDVSETDVIV